MNKLISREVKNLSPEEASLYLSYERLKAQREIKQSRVEYLMQKMENGRWHNAAVVVTQNGEVSYLVNGQHTSKAIVDRDKPASVTLLKYSSETLQDISELIRQFDDASNTRTIAEILRIESDALGREWRYDIPPLVVGGAIMYKNGFYAVGKRKITRDLRAEALKEYSDIGDILQNYRDDENFHLLKKIPVVAALIAMFRKRKHTALIFWESILDGVGLKRNSPELKLRTYLFSKQCRSHQDRKEMLVRCIHAWNAYIKGETTDLKYYKNSKIPKVL